MASMFRSVSNIEKRMQKYGVSALRLRMTPASPTTNINASANQQEGRGFGLKLIKLGKYLSLTADASQTNHRYALWCCSRCPCAGDGRHVPEKRLTRSTKSNNMTSQKRAVLQMAIGYAGAWLLVWTPFFVLTVSFIIQSSLNTNVVISDNAVIWWASMTPLQGLFNFVVFMAPKARTTRKLAKRRTRTGDSRSDNNNHQNQQQHMTWCQAFYKAYYMDRGRRRENTRKYGLEKITRRHLER